MVRKLTFSVVVPTYGRGELLARCLDGLVLQTYPAMEILVVRPRGDVASEGVARRYPRVWDEIIEQPSNIAGIEAGAKRACGEVVCFIDDDAVAPPDWLARMAAHFADRSIGAVGGRDRQPGSEPRPDAPVGMIGDWGRLVGNHHVGAGAVRDVHLLKGVNMAFRRDLLAVPVELRGGPTRDHFEIAMSLWVLRNGARVVYDPHLCVDHLAAPRVDGTGRFSPDPVLARASAFNLVYSIASLRPKMAVRLAVFGLFIGDRGCPGVVRAAVGLLQRDRSVYSRLLPSLRGQMDALGQIMRGRPLSMRRVADGALVTSKGRV